MCTVRTHTARCPWNSTGRTRSYTAVVIAISVLLYYSSTMTIRQVQARVESQPFSSIETSVVKSVRIRLIQDTPIEIWIRSSRQTGKVRGIYYCVIDRTRLVLRKTILYLVRLIYRSSRSSRSSGSHRSRPYGHTAIQIAPIALGIHMHRAYYCRSY